MLKRRKWLLLSTAFISVILLFMLANKRVKSSFDPTDFKRYDLIISESTLFKMDSLAKPMYNDYTNSKSWFQAKIIVKQDTLNTKIRLKGDKEDHYNSNLLSWRLKYRKKGKKRVVSLQHPKTRKYISEWIFHQLLQQEDLPFLKYNFVAVYVNNKFKGFYAEEEHFSNHKIEKKWHRPHGPILRFDDENFWPEGLYKSQAEFGTNAYLTSEINGFNFSKKEQSSELYIKAVNALEQYRNRKLKAEKVFDLKLMGKFYALVDLAGGYHCLRWINMRYYFNPSTHLFEPVGYDSDAKRITQLSVNQKSLNPAHHEGIMKHPLFLKSYKKHLKTYSQKGFLDDFFSQHEKELQLYFEAFQHQFNVNKSYSNWDLYLNQWVMKYHMNNL